MFWPNFTHNAMELNWLFMVHSSASLLPTSTHANSVEYPHHALKPERHALPSDQYSHDRHKGSLCVHIHLVEFVENISMCCHTSFITFAHYSANDKKARDASTSLIWDNRFMVIIQAYHICLNLKHWHKDLWFSSAEFCHNMLCQLLPEIPNSMGFSSSQRYQTQWDSQWPVSLKFSGVGWTIHSLFLHIHIFFTGDVWKTQAAKNTFIIFYLWNYKHKIFIYETINNAG